MIFSALLMTSVERVYKGETETDLIKLFNWVFTSTYIK